MRKEARTGDAPLGGAELESRASAPPRLCVLGSDDSPPNDPDAVRGRGAETGPSSTRPPSSGGAKNHDEPEDGTRI